MRPWRQAQLLQARTSAAALFGVPRWRRAKADRNGIFSGKRAIRIFRPIHTGMREVGDNRRYGWMRPEAQIAIERQKPDCQGFGEMPISDSLKMIRSSGGQLVVVVK